MSNVLNVTSIEEIKARSAQIVELPGWDERPFCARLKTISVFSLASQGKIPNSLFTTAIDLFEGKKKSVSGKGNEGENSELDEISKLMDIFIEASMLEPTYSEVKEYLTDEQKYAIFAFAQKGANALKSFRTEQANTGDN